MNFLFVPLIVISKFLALTDY